MGKQVYNPSVISVTIKKLILNEAALPYIRT